MTVVGHLGFGNQTPKMTEFYHSNPELFKLNNKLKEVPVGCKVLLFY